MVRYLHPANHNAARIRKSDKMFQSKVGFKDIKFPVKIKDICKIEKKNNYISISIFAYEKKEKYTIYVSKKTFKRYVDLLLIGENTSCQRF